MRVTSGGIFGRRGVGFRGGGYLLFVPGSGVDLVDCLWVFLCVRSGRHGVAVLLLGLP